MPGLVCELTTPGIAALTRATRWTVQRESLYKSISGNTKPEFDTVRKLLGSFGLKVVVEPDDEAKAA